METGQHTAFEHCVLTAFQLVLHRHDIALRTHPIARMQLPGKRDLTPEVSAQVWELALHCGSRIGYAVWVALLPGAIPDLLDVIVPSALEAPGPIPPCLIDLPIRATGWQRGALYYWARAVHAHDELQALLASITPDAASAACLRTELCAATGWCDSMRPPPEALTG